MIVKKNGEKLNNRGFTLMEILVAMCVLGIVVVPLLHTFVSAGTTNAKARKILKATTQAQNLMEELKASTVEEVAEKVCTGNVSGFPCYGFTSEGEAGGTYTSFEAVGNAVDGIYTQITGSAVYDEDGKMVFNGSVQADGSYCYVLPNVVFQGTSYDVIMKMVPEHVASNVDINSMNDTGAVLFTDSVSVHSVPAEYFWSKNQEYFAMTGQGTSRTASEFQASMSRETILTISKDHADKYSVSLQSVFSCGSTFNDDLEAEFRTYSESPDIRSVEAKSVYLFYYPLYGMNRDTIVIQNPNNLDVNVYLICMQGAEYTTENEINYRAKVKISETYISSEYTATADQEARQKLHMTLLSNINNSCLAIEDNNNRVVTRVGTLGNGSSEVYQYRTEVRVYSHDADAFSTGSTGMIFRADPDRLLVRFDGSLLEHSK